MAKLQIETRSAVRRRNSAYRSRRIPLTSTIDPLTFAALRDKALLVAIANRSDPQTGARVFPTTRATAKEANGGAGAGGAERVFYILLRGTFVCGKCDIPISGPPPPEASPPIHAVHVILRSSDLEITEVGFHPAAPAGISRLGRGASLGL